MSSSHPLPHRLQAVAIGAALLLCGGAARGQQEPTAPNVAEMEAALDQAWAAALAVDEDLDPLWRAEVWGTVFVQELVLDQARAVAQGVSEGERPKPGASRDRVLARWRRERPADAGPDLFLTFEIEDPAERLAATLALLDRHPDDALVLWNATNLLRNANQAGRAGELLEGFVQRNPASAHGHRMLVGHYGAVGNETRKAEVVARWAQREPLDPRAVSAWLGSPLGEQEPAATGALLERFFAGEPQSAEALRVCSEVARSRPDFREAARGCVARIAAGGDGGPAAGQAAEQASSELAAMAVREGDWEGLVASLDRLPAEQRRRALLAAVHQVAAPEGCETRVQLLRVAAEGGGDEEERGSVARSIASALKLCASHPSARSMYLDLLRTAPNPHDLVTSWTARLREGPGARYRVTGDLPTAEAAPLLERRLAEEPTRELAVSLYRALDVAYQKAGDDQAHQALLARWRRQYPEEMRSEQVVALAEHLLFGGNTAEAIALLEEHTEREVQQPVLETLWDALRYAEQPERAERLVAELLAGDEPRAAIGHLLAGRGAIDAEDLATAEREYTAYLARFASPEVAGELLAATSALQGSTAAAALAGRLCAAASFHQGRGEPAACAAALVAAGGDHQAATTLLAQQAAQRPDDLETLRDLAWKAQAAEQWEIAEQTRRRIVALDPRASAEWTHLGVVLEKRGKPAELEVLLGEARQAFQDPPANLLRAAGRAWTAAGDGRRAVPLLEEARAGMPAGSELGWIDQELRQAYTAVGRWENPYAHPADDQRLASLRRAAEGGDRAATYDHAVELLREERSAEQCEAGIAALERAATAGHKRSAAYLGRVLYYGTARCREASATAALPWLRRAVDETTKLPEGPFDLGLMLLLGDGGEPAAAEGVKWIEQAAAFPHLLAVEVAGLVHASGLGVPRDIAKARHYFAEADRLGSDSLARLAQNAADWRQIARLTGQAVERLQALAGEGDAAAAGLLARLHQLGHLVPRDAERAQRLARAAAARGDATGMRVLYHAHLGGGGGTRDDVEAMRWLRRGAEAGDSYCMMFLAHRLMEGETVPRDLEGGLAWLERAAAAGNYWALGDLAHLHGEGWHGLRRDAARATPWMQQLAARGDFEARGWLLVHGHEVAEMAQIDE